MCSLWLQVSGTFVCMDCQMVIKDVPQQFKYSPPTICRNPVCNNRSRFHLDTHKSKFIDFQKVVCDGAAVGSLAARRLIFKVTLVCSGAHPGDAGGAAPGFHPAVAGDRPEGGSRGDGSGWRPLRLHRDAHRGAGRLSAQHSR